MNLIFTIARNFICKKNSRRLSFTSIVSILGVAFGVAAFLVVITILNSFEKEMKNIISSINPNLVVFSQSGIAQVEQFEENLSKLIGQSIEKQSKFIYQESIVSYKQQTSAIYLRAIDGYRSASASQLSKMISPVSAFSSIDQPSNSNIKNIILGKELAENLGVKVGDFVTLMSFGGIHNPVQYHKLLVTGIIHIGISQYDKEYGLLNFLDSQKMFGIQGWASGVEIKLKNPDNAIDLAKKLSDIIPYTAVPWQNIDKNIFTQIERDSTSIKLIVLIISFVAGFNIIITLGLTVVDRSRQISLLRCLGAKRSYVILIFIFSGLFLGFLGSALGLLLGMAFLNIFSGLSIGNFQNFYYLESIPVQFDFKLICIAFFTSLLLSFLGALYPAWRGTKVSPLIGLK